MAAVNGTAHSAEMAEGLKSQFDVIVDGRTLFSKQRVGRFPDVDEVLDLLPSS